MMRRLADSKVEVSQRKGSSEACSWHSMRHKGASDWLYG
jgi:hypothetical protein